MSTLSKQSIISAVTDSLQDASYPSSQILSPLDSNTLSSKNPSDALLVYATEKDAITELMSAQLSAVERQQKGLQLLSQHAAIHSGDLSAAAAVITQIAAIALGADRVSLWFYTVDGCFEQLASHNALEQTTTSGVLLPEAEYALYFETLNERSGYAIENVSEHRVDATNGDATNGDATDGIECLAQQALIFQTPGAFQEMPIRCQGKVAGALWVEYTQSHVWSDLENATMLSISLLAAAAKTAQKQNTLSASLASHSRQLKRETIEREQAEQAWQESQRFIQGIIDASTNILYVDSFADGSNFYISRWIKNVLGYEIHEVQKLGPNYLEQLVHADQKLQIASERQKLAAINDGEVVENEYQFRHRQGNWRWLLCRETVFQRDENGEPTQIFGTATDITKRKHAEDALKEFNKELTRLARMDGLTQVANRRAFDQYLRQEWNNVGAGRSSLSLILCDIDYFKNFNDTYGHQAGDVCLRQVAQAIERAVKRSTDLVARYGGEEFAIILPNTTIAGLNQVASEIQREIRELAIPHSRSEVSDFITLSLGLTLVSATENIHPDMLVAAADQGLYQAKYAGRDRYCFSEVESEA
ncbi:MAG: diguanylate cyclase [Phormidesmis sp.]